MSESISCNFSLPDQTRINAFRRSTIRFYSTSLFLVRIITVGKLLDKNESPSVPHAFPLYLLHSFTFPNTYHNFFCRYFEWTGSADLASSCAWKGLVFNLQSQCVVDQKFKTFSFGKLLFSHLDKKTILLPMLSFKTNKMILKFFYKIKSFSDCFNFSMQLYYIWCTLQ